MKHKYFFILLFSWFSTFSQGNRSIIFEEKKIDSADSKIDTILIIGIGSTPTRIFLDDLIQAFVKSLTDKGVVAGYYYLGKTTAEAKQAFDTISMTGYNAILFFLPNGDSYFDIRSDLNRNTSYTRAGPITTTTPTSRVDYEQVFNLQLYIQDTNMKKVWTASLEVSGDLSKSKNAKKVSSKLLSLFINNKYIK